MPRTVIQCPRCGYQTDHLGSYDKHINKKTLCRPLLSDVRPTIESVLRGTVHAKVLDPPKPTPAAPIEFIDCTDPAAPKTLSTPQAGDVVTNKQVLCATDFSHFDVDEITLPTNCSGRGFVYMLACGLDNTGRVVVKFGKTEGLRARMDTHKRAFPNAKVVALIDVGAFSPTPVETSVRGLVENDLVLVEVHGSRSVQTHGECFAVQPTSLGQEINRILSFALSKHAGIVQRVECSKTIELSQPVIDTLDFITARLRKVALALQLIN